MATTYVLSTIQEFVDRYKEEGYKANAFHDVRLVVTIHPNNTGGFSVTAEIIAEKYPEEFLKLIKYYYPERTHRALPLYPIWISEYNRVLELLNL